MPTDYSGTILFQRDLQNALLELSYAPGFTEVQTLASVLHTMTTADIVKCTFTQSMNPQLTGTGLEIPDTQFAAHFKFRRTDPSADVRFFNFRLPAPKMEIFQTIEGKGYRIIQDPYGDTLASALSALRGESLEFDSGWLVH